MINSSGIYHATMSAPVSKTLIRAALNGIVYWVDNLTGDCYTYSDKPTLIGKAVKDPFEPKTLHIQFRSDWKTIMDRELELNKQLQATL